jgi:hypothetical protein
VRLVYILTWLAKGKNIRYRECEWIPARDLRDSLSKLTKGNSEIIFAGFDPHMRNSIFHFSFDYDDSLQRIHLEDYDHRRKNVVKTDITLAEFDRKYKYLDAVNNMIMNIFFILKAKDLIQAKDPWA